MKPKPTPSIIRFSLSALAMGFLTACGGAGGGGGGIGIADGGIRGTGSSVGPVSGFGSVFVNGVRFETDGINGQVQSDDGISIETQLDEGMILRVDGEWEKNGQGTASAVEYDDTLRGEITVEEPWDLATKTATLSIYGLIVHIDNQTVIKGKDVSQLAGGDFVRISAWRLPNNEFRASLVRVRPDSGSVRFDSENEIEVEGRVSNFDPDMCTFTIGSITVECDSESTEFDGISLSQLSSNPFVEVEGNFNGNVLFAREIEEDDLRRYSKSDEGDIEFAGPVGAAFNPSNNTFEINGLTVRVTGDTEFDDGLTSADLEPDLLIQVEGAFLEDGTVEAEEIELREGESEVEGRVAVNSVSESDQTFRIGGVLVQVTPLTAIVGEDELDVNFMGLGGPEGVEVSGIERTTSEGDVYLEAFKIEVDDDAADDGFELVGQMRSIDLSTISVLGVTIALNNDTEFDGADRDELAGLERPLIEVEYEEPGDGNFVAEEIELEEDDDD